ncbi:hypothetical protein B0T11DRAFT_329354 [Plectosphaerella cucumerina]|uniref:CFEM domain-containing protein n=1 Tax=Plectosphaerella cucumerina TaxID=40658 RepID=A0A8K0TKX0_9PEZI|nr:hypothetical protein B0T11DRAFT_329354 [Plectosphaerella cucumerina]
MKYFYTLAALVALVAAQAELPECAVSCIRDATESETTCTFGDTACTCQEENRAAVTAAATPCVISACGVQVAIGQVQPATEAICAAAGEAPASSAAAPPASSAAAPPASSAAAPPASSAAAPPASSAAAPSGDDAYPLPSVVPTSAHSAVPSAAPSAAPSGNGTVTPPVEPPVEAGAAKAGFMGAAALAGFVALAL